MCHYTSLQVHQGTIVIKAAWYYHKNGHIDQLAKTEKQGISPQSYIHVIFGKETHTQKCTLE